MNAMILKCGFPRPGFASLVKAGRRVKFPAPRLMVRHGLPPAIRAANRLLWTLWLSLPLVLWLSSDWIGMIVLWQALSAAARLIQNPTTNPQSKEDYVRLDVFPGGYRVR